MGLVGEFGVFGFLGFLGDMGFIGLEVVMLVSILIFEFEIVLFFY